MEKLNYSETYKELTQNLSPKFKNILEKRFGIRSGKPQTLETIGKELGVTRERIRQIQKAAFSLVEKRNQIILGRVSQQLGMYLRKNGGFKREDIVLEELGGQGNKSYVSFLLYLGSKSFSRICGKQDYYHFWQLAKGSSKPVIDNLNSIVSDIKKSGKLLTREELFAFLAPRYNFDNQTLLSYIEISKNIGQNKDGKFGLVSWPEIKPRGVRDKAFLVLKQSSNPLHFKKIAELVGQLGLNYGNKTAHPQTVHNELIKDPRFVLVGRGTYALGERGYSKGTIKDVIAKVLGRKQGGAQKDEVIKEVLRQRLVARNTVLINLNNKKYFKKDSQGNYFLRETQTA